MTDLLIDEDTETLVEDIRDDAPYGVNPKTGRPYKFPPEKRAEWAARMAAARWGNTVPKAPTKTATAGGRKTAGKAAVDYRPGIIGLAQIPAFALGILAKYTRRPTLALDSATITLHAPNVAEAVQQTAQQQPWLADLLDKVLAVGPYGALLAAGLPVALQIAANHGRIDPNPEMGILDEDGLRQALMSQAGGKP